MRIQENIKQSSRVVEQCLYATPNYQEQSTKVCMVISQGECDFSLDLRSERAKSYSVLDITPRKTPWGGGGGVRGVHDGGPTEIYTANSKNK